MTAARDPHDAAPAPAQHDVCAIIVSYRPDTRALQDVLDAVAPQVGRVLLFDNGSEMAQVNVFLDGLAMANVQVVRSARNLGLGAAFNRAAAMAQAQGAGHLLLMDQDSVLQPGTVARLKQAFEQLSRNADVAAVGPQFVDARNGHVAPFVRIGFPVNRKVYGAPAAMVEADFLITSGTFTSAAQWQRLGGLDEGLFIDNVDLEWCFRARHRGMRLFGVCDARMLHSIGDRVRPSRLKRGGVILHSPARLYYMMRNRLVLYRRAETPRVWIAQDLPRLLLKLVGTALFVAPRGAYLRSMLRGLRDGVRGVSGPLP